MTRIDHPSLGPLEFDEDGVADSQVSVGDVQVEFDVWFEDGVNAELLDAVAVPMARVSELHQANLQAIRRDLADDDPDSAAGLHREFHLREFDPEERTQVFGTSDPDQVDDEVYMSALRLRRIGAYPDAEDPHLVWDYGFDPDLSDHLVSIAMDFSGRIMDISLES